MGLYDICGTLRDLVPFIKLKQYDLKKNRANGTNRAKSVSYIHP